MTSEGVGFELAALYRAVDSKRLRRRLKWPDVADEIGLPLKTVQSTRFAETMEADTVLAMVRWLGVAPETFVRPEREGPIPEYMDGRDGLAGRWGRPVRAVGGGEGGAEVDLEGDRGRVGEGVSAGVADAAEGRRAGVDSPAGRGGRLAGRANGDVYARG